MSLHINIDYILNNIIFVKLETKYVFIEKHAWNTLVSTFFRYDQRTSKKLQEFKNFIFDLYFSVKILKEQVNLENIQQQILLMIEPDLDQEIKSMEVESSVMNVDAQFVYNDESNLYMEQYIGSNTVAENFQVDEKVFYKNIDTIFDKANESVKESINALRVAYDFSDSLVKTIGFMRCVNLLMSFVLENQVYVRSEHERKLIEVMINDKNSIFFYLCQLKDSFQNSCNGCICKKCRNENFEPYLNSFYKCRKCSSENTCNYHLDYNFYCQECKCINTHGDDQGKITQSTMSNRNLIVKINHQKVLLFDQKGLSQCKPVKLTDYETEKNQIDSIQQMSINDNNLVNSNFQLKEMKIDGWGHEVGEKVEEKSQVEESTIEYGGFGYKPKRKGLW